MQKDKSLRLNARKVSKTALAISLCLVIFVTNIGAISAADTPSSWAAEQVNEAIAEGLVPQNLQSNYTNAITRAEFAALAVALYENVKGEIKIIGYIFFRDTEDVNVKKAAFIGIVMGIGDRYFDPDSTLTREQAAVMLSRLADKLDNPLPRQAATFSDNVQISEWAIESVGYVAAGGIMGGVGNNTFSPKGSYTREQSIVTIMRLFTIVKPEIPTEELVEGPVALAEAEVYSILMSFQETYPDGMKWTNEDRYVGNNGTLYMGCWAFAMILSDAAFGNFPSRYHEDFNNVRVGDILVKPGHAIIVLSVDEDFVMAASGNDGGIITWWTKYPFDWLKTSSYSKIYTRWSE